MKQVIMPRAPSQPYAEAVSKGVFDPELQSAPDGFTSLRAALQASIAMLKSVPPGERDSLAGRDMRFDFKDFRIDFTVENFLLSFSPPNFHFHATTAYDILRHQRVDLGKGIYADDARTKCK